MEHSEEESVLLLIKEESKFATAKRITRIHTILDQMSMRGYNPMDDDSPIEMISSGDYKFEYLIISLEYEDLNKMIQKCKTYFPNIGILIVYDKNTANLEDKLSDLEKTFGVKSSLDRSAISMHNLSNAFKQIKTDNILKKGSNQRYSFIQNINSGMQGIVDLYLDTEKERLIAIKRIQTDGMSKEQRAKVILEVDLMKSIKTPTIIEFYDSTFDNDFRYIYMEYADAGTLEEKIKEHKIKGQNFTFDTILNWIIEILIALFTMNRRKMMHRDIKSENVLLKTTGKNEIVAKLSDLGISRQVIEGVKKLTLCGTPYYVCPEIASELETYGFNIDIWSLGVVLYELVTLRKPFGDYSETDKTTENQNLSPSELYEIIKTKPYPKLSEDTDPRFKFLIKNMLRKNPNRRFDIEDCLKLDFVYDRMIELVNKFGWAKDISDYEYLVNLGKYKTPCYKLLDIIDDKDILLVHETYKVFSSCAYSPYKKSFFSGNIHNTVLAKTLIEVFNELKEENEEKGGKVASIDAIKTDEHFFSQLLEKEILIPISHPNTDLEKSINTFFESPENSYYILSFDNYENSMKIDNFSVINDSYLKIFQHSHYDLVSLSQFILKQGKFLYKRMISEEMDQNVNFTDDAFVKFFAGISTFKKYSIMEIPEENERFVFLLNLHQIMFIHYLLIFSREENPKKVPIFNYLFKDMQLNNLEIKNVVFRNNKKPPNSYFRLVYANDLKTRILQNFDDLRPLFIFYDFDLDALEMKKKYRFKIFKQKGLETQLDRVVLKFVYRFVRKEDNLILIPSYMQPYIQDFDQSDTEEFPQHLLSFLSDKVKENLDPNVPDILKLHVDQATANQIDPIFTSLTPLLKNLQSKTWRVSYF